MRIFNDAMTMLLFSALGALTCWALLQPDPMLEASGRKANAELQQMLADDERTCWQQHLGSIDEPTDAQVEQARAECSRGAR